MRCLVTGGAGFIGSHIAARLLKSGHEVLVIDDLSAGKTKNIPEGAEFINSSILHITPTDLEGVDAVFHNAASKKNICLIDPEYDMTVNGIGTLALLKLSVNVGVKHFIHASTGSVYGEVKGTITENSPYNPVSYYGVSKLAGERYVSLFHDKMKTVILRYFHVYGPRQEDDPNLGGVVAVFKKQIKDGGIITLHGDGSQKRVFTRVEDVVEANLAALHLHPSGKVYNCCSNYQVSVMALAGSLIRKADKPVSIKYLPPLPGDIYNFDVDNSKILQELGVSFSGYKL